MSDAPLATTDQAEALPAPPAGRGRLIILIVGVVVLAALGAGAWFFVVPRFMGTSAAKPAAPVEVPVKATVSLGAVVVNLTGEARRYLRVGVSLGLASPKDVKEVEEHKSQLLDLLISVFATAGLETLTSEDGKAELKKALLERMHEQLHLKTVARVYFTEFVIQ